MKVNIMNNYVLVVVKGVVWFYLFAGDLTGQASSSDPYIIRDAVILMSEMKQMDKFSSASGKKVIHVFVRHNL